MHSMYFLKSTTAFDIFIDIQDANLAYEHLFPFPQGNNELENHNNEFKLWLL